MVTTDAFDPHPDRTRWLRRAGFAAIATAALGIGGTGLAVGVLSAHQSDNGTTGTPSNSSGSQSSDDSGSSGSSSNGDSSGSGLGQSQQGATSHGGSHGS
jgi:hypothetical protein